MRVGKPLEHAQAAVKTLEISDPVLKYTALGRQLGYAGYLVNDMLIWVRVSLQVYRCPPLILTLASLAITGSHCQGGSLLTYHHCRD